jgi:hypothetical protein
MKTSSKRHIRTEAGYIEIPSALFALICLALVTGYLFYLAGSAVVWAYRHTPFGEIHTTTTITSSPPTTYRSNYSPQVVASPTTTIFRNPATSATATTLTPTTVGSNLSASGLPLFDSGNTRIVAADNIAYPDSVAINGVTSNRGMYDGQFTSYAGGPINDSYVDVNLSRAFRRLSARVGVLDKSKASGSSAVNIYADGRLIYSQRFSLGVGPNTIVLDVTGVLRLRVAFSCAIGVPAAMGDPTLYP